MPHLKTACIKALIILIPSYAAAWLTGAMVWVVPTLAAAMFFASSVGQDATSLRRRLDEEDSDDGEDEGEDDGEDDSTLAEVTYDG